MGEKADKQPKKQPDEKSERLRIYQWKPGQSGNLNGRPPGKSAKTRVKEWIAEMSDIELAEFLNHIEPDVIWKMAEGNPHQAGNVEVTIPQNIIDLIKDAKAGSSSVPGKD